MKKLFTLTLLSTVLVFTQCKKGAETVEPAATAETSVSVTVTDQNKLAVQSLKSLPSQSLKRLAYNVLLPVEKYLLWVDNINTVSKSFSPAQQKLATELTTFIRPRHFAESNSFELREFGFKWVSKAEKVFTFDQMAKLVYIIDASTNAPEVAVNNSGLQVNIALKPDCNCHSDSDFSCVYGTNQPQRGNCPEYESDGCERKSLGCGFMGGFACNNICKFLKVEPAE